MTGRPSARLISPADVLPRGHRPQPVVLPISPRRGWEQADLPRRVFALVVPGFVLIWLGSVAAGAGSSTHPVAVALSGVFTLLVTVVGPPACYSAARVLRPHPTGTGLERKARHWCAAVATAYGVPLVAWMWAADHGVPTHSFEAGWLYIMAASTLGPVTLAWGAGSFLGRLAARLIERPRVEITTAPMTTAQR